jgi:hypothetical protein
MAKHLILIISLFLLISCGSRKVNLSKLNTEVKVDSSVVIKIDGTYVKENDIVTNISTEEIEYKPADTSRPMVIDGVVFKNVIIKKRKDYTRKVDKTKEVEKTSSVKKLNVKRLDVKKSSVKAIDKKTNYLILLWLLLPIVLIYLLWKNKLRMFKLLNV